MCSCPPAQHRLPPAGQQGEERASKRAQTALRDIAVRRWDSAMGETVSCAEIAVKPMLGLEFSSFDASLPADCPARGHRRRRCRVPARIQCSDWRNRGREVHPRRSGGASPRRPCFGGARENRRRVATVEAIFRRGDHEIVIRREVTAQGRSRAFIDGDAGDGRRAQGPRRASSSNSTGNTSIRRSLTRQPTLDARRFWWPGRLRSGGWRGLQ